jgi:threonine synthase
MSLYISPSEIPPADLRDIIARSYSTFRSPEITPLVRLREKHHLLELFHGPTFASKDIASQFLGNLLEYFLIRKNESKTSTAGMPYILSTCHPVDVTSTEGHVYISDVTW